MSISRRTAAVKATGSFLLVGALAAGGYGIAQAAAGSPRIPATEASSSHPSTPPPGSWLREGGSWKGPRHLRFAPAWALPGAFLGAGVVGTIKTINNASFVLQTGAGSTLTVKTSSSTTYHDAFSTTSRAALAVGEHVAVVFTEPGKPAGSAPPAVTRGATAAAVEIILPSLQGQVVSDTGGTIVISDWQGFHRTIDTNGSTVYKEAGAAVPATSVASGVDIVAVGSVAANHTDLDATAVDIVGPVVAGRVSKVSGATVTLKTIAGHTLSVTTSGSTIFRSGGKASSLAKVKVGDLLLAIGTPEGTAGFAASAVRFGSVSSVGLPPLGFGFSAGSGGASLAFPAIPALLGPNGLGGAFAARSAFPSFGRAAGEWPGPPFGPVNPPSVASAPATLTS